MEMYYGRKINPGWGICFLLTSQMIGYAFTGIYRDILVRPPKIYYPGGMMTFSLLPCYMYDHGPTQWHIPRCPGSFL